MKHGSNILSDFVKGIDAEDDSIPDEQLKIANKYYGMATQCFDTFSVADMTSGEFKEKIKAATTRISMQKDGQAYMEKIGKINVAWL